MASAAAEAYRLVLSARAGPLTRLPEQCRDLHDLSARPARVQEAGVHTPARRGSGDGPAIEIGCEVDAAARSCNRRRQRGAAPRRSNALHIQAGTLRAVSQAARAVAGRELIHAFPLIHEV